MSYKKQQILIVLVSACVTVCSLNARSVAFLSPSTPKPQPAIVAPAEKQSQNAQEYKNFSQRYSDLLKTQDTNPKSNPKSNPISRQNATNTLLGLQDSLVAKINLDNAAKSTDLETRIITQNYIYKYDAIPELAATKSPIGVIEIPLSLKTTDGYGKPAATAQAAATSDQTILMQIAAKGTTDPKLMEDLLTQFNAKVQNTKSLTNAQKTDFSLTSKQIANMSADMQASFAKKASKGLPDNLLKLNKFAKIQFTQSRLLTNDESEA